MKELDTLAALIVMGTITAVIAYWFVNNSTQWTQILNQLGTSGNLDFNALTGN